jgi:hypothetical protein
MSVSQEKAAYRGLERRSSCDRRIDGERRNLVRYDALGSDRRERMLRRREDMLWFATQDEAPADNVE